jgi:hypothetical protein
MNNIEDIALSIADSVLKDDKNVVLVASTIEAGQLIIQSVFCILYTKHVPLRKCGIDIFIVDRYIKVTTYERENEDTQGLHDYVRFDYRFD